MRRSEICALTAKDLKGDIVKINKAMVQNENEEWVVESTKTAAGTREIIIPFQIAEKIKKQGYAYNGSVNSITYFLFKMQDELGIPHFGIHKLRHYFASKMRAMNIPEADILKTGGWGSDYFIKSVYRHSMTKKEENAKRKAAKKLQKALFS